jgi:hypothetical protein
MAEFIRYLKLRDCRNATAIIFIPSTTRAAMYCKRRSK